MRMLLAVSAIALGVFAGATAADAQSTRIVRTPPPHAAGQYPYANPPGRWTVAPYATSNSAYYDPHFSQYPEWAQKAFTPGWRR